MDSKDSIKEFIKENCLSPTHTQHLNKQMPKFFREFKKQMHKLIIALLNSKKLTNLAFNEFKNYMHLKLSKT